MVILIVCNYILVMKSAEELIAEIGSIFFGYEFNITKTIPDNHAKYLNSWIKALKEDYTLIATAFAQAQKAVDYFVSTK